MKEQQWIDDCTHYHGKALTGKYRHYCPEWDGLPIDETCEEFKVCTCYRQQKELKEYMEGHNPVAFLNGINVGYNAAIDDAIEVVNGWYAGYGQGEVDGMLSSIENKLQSLKK